MSFFLKNSDNGELLFQQGFTAADFEKTGYSTQEFTLDFPFGQTKIVQWAFDGVRMICSESEFTEPAILEWKGDTEMVIMYFNLQGKISIEDTDNIKPFELAGNQHNMFYGRVAEGKMKVEELKTRSFMVQLSKETFLKISDNGNDALKRFVNAVRMGKSAAFSEHNLSIDYSIQNCINTILRYPYSNELKKMFLQSKTIELLVLQAESFNRAQNNTNSVLKTEYDNERIVFARDYLLKNIDCPPTLPELSKIVGINEFKLKYGFKEIFDQTVYQYVSNTRLDYAKTHLLERKKSATELAFELGYSSVQHFSTAFKKKFGVSPNQLK